MFFLFKTDVLEAKMYLLPEVKTVLSSAETLELAPISGHQVGTCIWG